jgi:HlyD family secretion protein
VRLCLSGAPAFLKPEMTVSAELVGGRQSSALVLPTPLVRDADKAQPWVLVLRQSRAVKVPVQLGLRGVGYSQITEGLQEGDRVIAPTQSVLPGDRVRPGAPRAAPAVVDVPSFVR